MPPKPPAASGLANGGSVVSTANKKRPAASEIDDIFAKKPKPTTAPPASATAGDAAAIGKNKKKCKKGKDKAESEPAHVPADAKGQPAEKAIVPKKVPETVVDTSAMIESYKPTAAHAGKKAKDMTEEEKKAAEEEQRFMDSRGTRKKTEDGLPIYDTSELKIGLGGDTELCPFDCECCF
ncbi:hypothetical protein JCM10212_001672 [Sporobolomyces blumeae]